MFRVEEPRGPGIDKAAKQGRYAGLMGNGGPRSPTRRRASRGRHGSRHIVAAARSGV